jgi:hypothetical protein
MTDSIPRDPAAAFRSLPVLTRAKARDACVPLEALLGPTYTKLFYDAYIPSTAKISLRTQAETALRVVAEGAHISHHTAVQLWGGVSPATSRIHLTFADQRARTRREGIAAHRSPLQPATTRSKGLLLSTPTQAFLDLASAGTELVDLVVAGDSLVKATRTTPEDFVRAAETWCGNRARMARRAARLIREGVDSPMETRLRLLLVLAGFPEPTVNLILRAADGEWFVRFDLSYEQWKLAIEYDGRQHAFDRRQWASDIDRREALDRLGWRLIVIRAEDLYAEPGRTLQRIREALVERDATGIPSRFGQEWSRHFPSRTH